jgi:oligopeptide transport system substrate-binding protein
VYSWRRTLDPVTAGPFAYLMYGIENAEEINSGKARPEKLGVRALDQYTFQVDLKVPVPYFLELAATKYMCPVPRHRVQGAGKEWTEPRHIAITVPFTLRERRSGDKLVLERNPCYYDAGAVPLEEIEFVPMTATAASANLYRTAEAVMTPVVPSLIPALSRKRDYRPNPCFGIEWANLRTTQAPFNDVRVRYALNMATDKRAIANLRPGQMPAKTLVPPMRAYRPPAEVRVQFGDSEEDVLAYNPRRARELMDSATGTPGLRMRYTLPPFPNMQLVAQILQQQWKQVLNIDLDLAQLDVATWVQATFDKNYPGIVASGDAAPYLDASYFLQEFTSAGAGGSDWANPGYDSMLASAAVTRDRADRLQRLAECESRLLAAMPIVPLSTFVQPSLAKPFVRGLSANPLDREQFKYVWIDTQWRPV